MTPKKSKRRLLRRLLPQKLRKQPKQQPEKWHEYADRIHTALNLLFDEKSDCYIGDPKDLDLTQFFHALANAVPAHWYNTFTGSNSGLLEFNHIANRLVFQYTEQPQQ